MKTARCTCCGTVQTVNTMVKTQMPNRGNAHAYMCQRCANQNEYYHTNNDKNRGVQKANNVRVGIELETAYTNDYARNILFEYGLIPTNDCSLRGRRTCEYVSGIQEGLNIASKMWATVETLINGDNLEINNSCGTHFHVSINNMQDNNGNAIYMNYIRRFYNSLFTPLSDYMKSHTTATEKLFGRDFNHYAKPITLTSDPHDRYYFINVTNDNNIEFRLNYFQNAKQTQLLNKMEVEIVKTVIANFCKHFDDENIDTRRYANQTEYRKHKAQMTANKIVKLFIKYADML